MFGRGVGALERMARSGLARLFVESWAKSIDLFKFVNKKTSTISFFCLQMTQGEYTGPMNVDFQMKIMANGWTSDVVKYQDITSDSEHLVDMLNDLDLNVSDVSLEFTAHLTHEQLMRFFMLLRKSIVHVCYHGGRQVISLPSNSTREPGDSYRLGVLCVAVPAGSFGSEPVSVSISFPAVVNIKNQNIRGTTIMANLSRLANALAWSMTNDVKLSSKPITLRTWNTITIWGDNPWHKEEAKTPATVPGDVYEVEGSDV
jgi:hypothetical protein